MNVYITRYIKTQYMHQSRLKVNLELIKLSISNSINVLLFFNTANNKFTFLCQLFTLWVKKLQILRFGKFCTSKYLNFRKSETKRLMSVINFDIVLFYRHVKSYLKQLKLNLAITMLSFMRILSLCELPNNHIEQTQHKQIFMAITLY